MRAAIAYPIVGEHVTALGSNCAEASFTVGSRARFTHCERSVRAGLPGNGHAQGAGEYTLRRLRAVDEEEVHVRKYGIALGVLSLFGTGCFTVRVNAPPGTQVYLADSAPSGGWESGATTHVYLVSGLAPVNDNTTAGIIKPECGRVALVTEMTFTDGLISLGLSVASTLAWSLAVSGAGADPGVATIGAGLTNLLLVPQLRTTKAYCTERRSGQGVPAPYAPPAPSQQPADTPTQPSTPESPPATPQQPAPGTKP